MERGHTHLRSTLRAATRSTAQEPFLVLPPRFLAESEDDPPERAGRCRAGSDLLVAVLGPRRRAGL